MVGDGTSLEDVWSAVEALATAGDESSGTGTGGDFEQLQEELGQIIVDRGLGGKRYSPLGSEDPGHVEPQPDEGLGEIEVGLEVEPERRGHAPGYVKDRPDHAQNQDQGKARFQNARFENETQNV